MADRHDIIPIDPGDRAGEPADDLASRLDALGRSLVSAETTARSAEPPRAFLEAVDRRGMFARTRSRVPLLAAAAAVLFAGMAVVIYSRHSATTPPNPPIAAMPAGSGVDVPGAQPTMGNITAMNRDVARADSLRLPSSGSTAAADTIGLRPADARRTDRIDAVIGPAAPVPLAPVR